MNQVMGNKRNLYGKSEIFYRQILGTTRGIKVLELGGNNGGHVRICLELLKIEEESC